MSHRVIGTLLMVALLASALVAGLRLTAQADEVNGPDPVQVNLKVQLEKALKARRPVEFDFIAVVLDLVEKETLPLDLVQSSFNWARKKPSSKVQYFEQSLRLRAARRNIEIPPSPTSLSAG